MEMSRVKPKAPEDDDLLQGLQELSSKEQEELAKKRASFTPRESPDEAAGNASQSNKANEEETRRP